MIFNVQSYKVITLGSNIINKDTVNGVWLTRCLGGSTVQSPVAAGGMERWQLPQHWGVPQVGVSPRSALSQGKKEGAASHACSRALHPQPQMLGAQGAIITHSPSLGYPASSNPLRRSLVQVLQQTHSLPFSHPSQKTLVSSLSTQESS